MWETKYTIPHEFQSQLCLIEAKDSRSEYEIVQSLKRYVPVTSERNIWAFWHSGFHNMPSWCQRNVVDWARLCGPLWTIRVLDNVPNSPNNALNYVSEDLLPQAFVKRTMDGPYAAQHSADVLRGACLYLYGGVWMDVGIILIRDIATICWNRLEDPNSPFRIAVPWLYAMLIGNWFVASRKDDPFIKRWHDLYMCLWKGRNNYEGIIDHPLLAFVRKFDHDSYTRDPKKFNFDMKVDSRTIYGYAGQVLAWNRLCLLEDVGDGFSCTEYWQHNMLIIDGAEEHWGAEMMLGFDGKGQEFLDLLSCRLDTDTDSEQYQKAYKLVWKLLTKTSLQKIAHAKNLTYKPSIGTLLDLPEHEGKDCAPGTFADLLRYGSVHFEQTREKITCVEAPKPPKTFRKGIFES